MESMAKAGGALNARSSRLLSPLSSISTILSTLKHESPDSSDMIPSQLNQFSSSLNPTLVVEVIKAHSNPLHALIFFRWAANPNPNPNNYFHTQRCYSAMIDLLISHSMFSTALALLESSNNLSDFMVGKFIRAYGDRGDIRGAINWFHRAKTIQSGRCLYCYNAILGVLVRANRVQLARAFFDQILEEGVVKPDVWTYTTMIRGFCKLGMVEDAEHVFNEMTCKPNLITCNTIVDGFCRKGLTGIARKIVDRMVATNDCLPDTVTYTTLINGYCKQGELEEADKCMDEMVSRNCEPNVLTYNSLIDGYCSSGKTDEAKMMMSKMRLNGFKDDVLTHTSLLRGLYTLGKYDDAAEHLRMMVRLGMEPDPKAYGVVVHGYCKSGSPGKAMALLDEMRERGMIPSVSICNSVLGAFCASGELDRAIIVLKQMLKWGCSPNFLSYSTVICSLCRARGRMNDAEELIVDMLRRGHCLDASMYSSLVRGYCENGNELMGMRMFSEMVRNGFVINLQSFLVLVKKLVGKGKEFDIEKVLGEMSMGCPVQDLGSYRKIIDDHLG